MPPRQPRNRLRYVAAGLLATSLLFIGPAAAWADESITLDFVRHAESGDMSAINTMVPGPDLTTPDGVAQANDVVSVLEADGPFAGIYASDMIRTQETADPLAEALGFHMPVPELSGLNEIDAGIFEGSPVNIGDLPLGGLLYLLAPFLWTFGLDFVPELGSTDPNGVAFDESFGGAVQMIYDQTVSGSSGSLTDAVFTSEGAMAIWALMNVNNPDYPLVLSELLSTGEVVPYTGIVEVQGDPEDGWTLISWDGQPVPQDPGLATELLVDVRDLISAPQTAAYNIWEAILSGDPTTIMSAIQTGVGDVGTAAVQFPVAAVTEIYDAVRDGIQDLIANPAGVLNLDTLLDDFNLADVASLLSTIWTEFASL